MIEIENSKNIINNLTYNQHINNILNIKKYFQNIQCIIIIY